MLNLHLKPPIVDKRFKKKLSAHFMFLFLFKLSEVLGKMGVDGAFLVLLSNRSKSYNACVPWTSEESTNWTREGGMLLLHWESF